MGLDYRAIARDQATATFPAGPGSENSITVTYRPSVLTWAWLNTDGDLVDRMPEVLVSWDLTDGDDPFPITPERLRDLPLPFLGHVLRSVLADMSLGKVGSGSSANGSSPTVSGAPART